VWLFVQSHPSRTFLDPKHNCNDNYTSFFEFIQAIITTIQVQMWRATADVLTVMQEKEEHMCVLVFYRSETKNGGYAPKALSMLRAPRGGKKERREKKKGDALPM